jgi:MFS family permease
MLTPSPLLISVVSTLASLPFFLLTLPAGALADLVDRKKLLCVINLWLAAAAAGLAIPGSLHRQSLHRSSYPVKSKAERMHESERTTGFEEFFST